MHSATAMLERLRERWEDPRIRIGALLLAALVAGLAWYQLGVSGGAASNADAPATSARAPADARRAPESSATSAPSQSVLVVQVAGAVAHPGVVRVRAGSRVVDAGPAAGGGRTRADLDRLNLASKVVDGQRIAVGLVGAAAPVESGTGGSTGTGDATTPGPVNLNTATAAELEELPGIGPSLAAAIIKERDKRGGFKSVGELQDVRGIGELRYADIKDLVSV
ncbi:MAG: helix-hairpin-helix domain-containing protein [Acidimicrobiia bacterium]